MFFVGIEKVEKVKKKNENLKIIYLFSSFNKFNILKFLTKNKFLELKMGNLLSINQEEINNKINQLKEEIEKEKQFYIKNKLNKNYNQNKNYENYNEEIIEGESILDCDLENIERQSEILSLYEEILKVIFKRKKTNKK